MALSPAKIAVTFSVVFTFCLCSLEASDGGFSVELIHRDSPRSPLYNPAETPTQRLRKSLARTIARANSLSQTAAATGSAPFSTITSNAGSYLMNISIGTPPFQILGIADTGSDLIWTQCEPCNDCFEQVAPLFDPQKSSTYRDVSCTSSTCSSLDGTNCGGNTCQYSYSYGDQSYTRGDVAVETAISVGRNRIEFGGSAGSASEGNIIIDSGTTLTLLPDDFYSQIESALTNQIELQPVDNPPVPDLPLCYRTKTDNINAPVLTAHFTGADVKLGPLNTFIRLDENNLCFAFAPIPTSVGAKAIYGNIAQVNFLVGYDIRKKAVSFKPIDCTKF
ncbi:hypothetical protein CRG98_031826 [Punica granatum]|uniref:Peptidase A1 domain-containing protein n=1 Tax=Punica granatum TaxID=22663 RepID=A0A2I0IWM6_PUNGR|nr:hypothetical protein CRG98_031826 [Punica granatum]